MQSSLCARCSPTNRQDGSSTCNLHGDAITQYELADYLNLAFGADLTYTSTIVEEHRNDRIAALGELKGSVIAGIYRGIRDGAADDPSHDHEAAGGDHVSWSDYFTDLAQQRATS